MFASESSHASSFKNFWICASQKPQPSKKCTTRWKHWDRTMPPLTKRNKTCTANKQNTLWRKGVVSFVCRWLCIQLGRLKVVDVSIFEFPDFWNVALIWRENARIAVTKRQNWFSDFPTAANAQRITVEDYRLLTSDQLISGKMGTWWYWDLFSLHPCFLYSHTRSSLQ